LKYLTEPLQEIFSRQAYQAKPKGHHGNKIQNPNIEIRNKPKRAKPKLKKIQDGLVLRFLILDHLKLFRISDFEFRICIFVYT